MLKRFSAKRTHFPPPHFTSLDNLRAFVFIQPKFEKRTFLPKEILWLVPFVKSPT